MLRQRARYVSLIAFIVMYLAAVGYASQLGDEVVSIPPKPARGTAEDPGSIPGVSIPARNPGPALLNIPRLHVRARVTRDVDAGPAWWSRTGRPGGGDTIAIAGHRTTFTRPFYYLERLQPGDTIYVRWHGRAHAYRVSGRRILSAKRMHIADARGHEILLLTACTPRGSARQRIVVYAWPLTSGGPNGTLNGWSNRRNP